MLSANETIAFGVIFGTNPQTFLFLLSIFHSVRGSRKFNTLFALQFFEEWFGYLFVSVGSSFVLYLLFQEVHGDFFLATFFYNKYANTLNWELILELAVYSLFVHLFWIVLFSAFNSTSRSLSVVWQYLRCRLRPNWYEADIIKSTILRYLGAVIFGNISFYFYENYPTIF